ncbi:MAG TPA: T6SS effector amidase Tae4 family protein [Cellvibrio sp.]|nr:T6SS effector amidase Tae4 family protein [Cellvibrio sp.]
MPTITAQTIWDNHPAPDSPCSTELFSNQCAIRMTVALEKSGVDTSSFNKMFPQRRCNTYWSCRNHKPGHILAAQELADWMHANPTIFGTTKQSPKGTKVSSANYVGKKGIVFIMNGWGSTDHIDIWDGSSMKGGSPQYFSLGEQVWFWELP